MKVCPTCGNPVFPSYLNVDLDINVVTYRGQSVKLGLVEAEILFVLAKQPGIPTSRESLVRQVYGAKADVRSNLHNLNQHVRSLRKHLEPLGLAITANLKAGYTLEFLENGTRYRPIAQWTDARISRLIDLCEARTPRNEIAAEFGWRIDQVVTLHRYVRERGRTIGTLPHSSMRCSKRRAA